MTELRRLSGVSRNEFLHDYVYSQTPVIFTDLFEGQPLSDLDTEEKARDAHGDMKILVYETYEDTIVRAMQGLLGGNIGIDRPASQKVTVSEYIDRMNRGEASGTLCSESPPSLWGRFAETFRTPEYCLDEAGTPEDYIPELWLGRNGHYTHMHYDTDGRNILLHQIYGSKRVLIAPPEAAAKFAPILNISAMCPEGLDDAAFEAWATFLGAFTATVHAGDTIFMPAYWWHSVEYLSNSMALTFRHRQNSYVKRLYQLVQPNARSQALSAQYVDPQAVTPAMAGFVDELERIAAEPGVDGQVVKANLRAAVERRYDEVFPQVAGHRYLRPYLADMVRMVEAISDANANFQSLRFDAEEHSTLEAHPA
jgi:lysine-specific demethylase 8